MEEIAQAKCLIYRLISKPLCAPLPVARAALVSKRRPKTAKLTKRQKAIAEKIEAGRAAAVGDAAALLSEISTVKFAEAIDVANTLVIRKSDQVVRGATTCPTGPAKPFV